MVKALPAMPAMPQPRPKVITIDLSGVMPTAPAITRFCTTARTCLPTRPEQHVATAIVIRMVSAITNMPLIGIWMESVACHDPIIQSGNSTPTSRAAEHGTVGLL